MHEKQKCPLHFCLSFFAMLLLHIVIPYNNILVTLIFYIITKSLARWWQMFFLHIVKYGYKKLLYFLVSKSTCCFVISCIRIKDKEVKDAIVLPCLNFFKDYLIFVLVYSGQRKGVRACIFKY